MTIEVLRIAFNIECTIPLLNSVDRGATLRPDSVSETSLEWLGSRAREGRSTLSLCSERERALNLAAPARSRART